MSTCFLVDDYTAQIPSPTEVIPKLLKAAGQCGIGIDYLVRESAQAGPDAESLARYIEIQGASESSPLGNTASAWLSDGARRPPGSLTHDSMPDDAEQAESPDSIYTDIRLWSQDAGGRKWSCSFLAAVWQLARLGLVDDDTRAYGTPWEGRLPSRWDELPSVIRLSDDAAPFPAYRTVSILDARYLSTEAAVRSILKKIANEPEILKRSAVHSDQEDARLPVKLVDRINYIFVGA